MDKNDYRMLIVAGNWAQDKKDARPSGVMRKLAAALIGSKMKFAKFDMRNGGDYDELARLRDRIGGYDFVIWAPNVDNDMEKVMPDKTKHPETIIVTTKNNRSGKYSFQELIQRALVTKSNLVIEITDSERFKNTLSFKDTLSFRLIDPLMNMYYEGTDVKTLAEKIASRLAYLKRITRQKTYQETADKSLVLKWYFDSFSEEMKQADKNIAVPPQEKFLELVHGYADIFTGLMPPLVNQERFIGNCSMKPNPVIGRCSKSMPSFRQDGVVFVSKRNIDKAQIQMEHFVPVWWDKDENIIKYCGEDKPSVDTPIQVRLYDALPQIKYMIHAHCYIARDNPHAVYWTNTVNPCGAIEEADEILDAIDRTCGSRAHRAYFINLRGHGSIIMASSIELLRDIKFESRPAPEPIYCDGSDRRDES